LYGTIAPNRTIESLCWEKRMFGIDWAALLDRIGDTSLRVLPRLLAVVVILFLLRYIVRFAERGTTRALGRIDLAPEAETILARLVRITVIVAGLVIVLLVMGWGQLAASFVAGLGISGLIIGFALQDITKNFAAGLLLLFMRPFRVGDRIAVGNDEGVVTDLALRATTLRTADGRELMVPNANMYTGTISNLTRYAQRRHTIELQLKPDVPLATALPALTDVLRRVEHILDKPAADFLVTAVKLEGVSVEGRFWLPSQGVDGAVVRSTALAQLRAVAIEKGWLVQPAPGVA
jgi:small-conductance mechanosensitive channel